MVKERKYKQCAMRCSSAPCKSLDRRTGAGPDLALHVLAYNLTRVMNIVGVQPLLAAMTA
jgi:hypothetical protein